jgi:hypothetical protein
MMAQRRKQSCILYGNSRIGTAFFVLLIIVVQVLGSQGFLIHQQKLKVAPMASHLFSASFPYYKKKNLDEEAHEGDDDEEGDEKQEWLSWMTAGLRPKRYSYDEVKMREDERLGGLPR